MTRLALAGAVAVAIISCGGSSSFNDTGGSTLPPPGSPTPLSPDVFPGAQGPEAPSQMALSADYVNLLVTYGGVYRIPKYGGEVVTVEQDFTLSLNVAASRGYTAVLSRNGYPDGRWPASRPRMPPSCRPSRWPRVK